MSASVPTSTANSIQVTAPLLRRALISGFRRVIEQREALDRINVFPVADGDTGSNLAFTLRSVLAGSLSRSSTSAGRLLRQVADDAIDGARGNSGAILAQFLAGMGERAANVRALTTLQLAEATVAGAQAARAALARPQEGTIISVISAFAEALKAHFAGDTGDPRRGFGLALLRARSALADTPAQLAVLRQAGVVDAGAQGFVDLLQGIAEYLESGRVRSADSAVATDPGSDALGALDLSHTVDPEHGWCTECLLTGSAIDVEGLRAALLQAGVESLVVAGHGRRLRVHGHVARPQVLFDSAARFGRVSAHKADDMRLQQRDAASARRVAVLTDSGADLPEARADALALGSVPVRVSFGDEDFLDKLSLSATDFHRRLRDAAQPPKTSQPPPGDFRRQFELRLSHHRQAVYVGLSRALSGTLQSAESAAARIGGGRVCVIDSGHASCGQALIALAIAEAAESGLDAAALANLASSLRTRTQTWAIARDMAFGVRGGRVPRWAGSLSQWLGLTPLARIDADGRLRIRGALTGGPRKAPQRFASHLLRRQDREQRYRLLVGHVDCVSDGKLLHDLLLDALDAESLGVVEVGPAIGAHAGPGALVVGLQQL